LITSATSLLSNNNVWTNTNTFLKPIYINTYVDASNNIYNVSLSSYIFSNYASLNLVNQLNTQFYTLSNYIVSVNNNNINSLTNALNIQLQNNYSSLFKIQLLHLIIY
jgi:hypothetical protein